MGLQRCECSAELMTSGEFPIGNPPLQLTAEFTLDINICPDCTLEDSFVRATVTIDVPIGSDVNIEFDGAPVGLPECENGVLTVEVAGTLSINGHDREVTTTLTLDTNEDEVCFTLPVNLPIIGNTLCIPVEGLAIEECVDAL